MVIIKFISASLIVFFGNSNAMLFNVNPGFQVVSLY